MSFTNKITADEAGALIPEEVAASIVKALPEQSLALRLGRTVNMGTRTQRIPVMNALANAYWVNGEVGLRSTTEAGWTNKFINAEEVSAIVPVANHTLSDSSFDIWAEVQPSVVEAIGKVVDDAIFFGVNKPASQPTAIIPGAVAAGNVVVEGTGVDLAEDISNSMANVEAAGFDVTNHAAGSGLRGKLRNLRDLNNNPLYVPISGSEGGTVYGVPAAFARNGSWDSSEATVVSGDFSKLVIGVRQDISARVLTEATIVDDSGNVVYALAQQNMTALMVTFRVGFQVPTPTTRDGGENAYAFSVVTPAGS